MAATAAVTPAIASQSYFLNHERLPGASIARV
jgi:hypothetical protein